MWQKRIHTVKLLIAAYEKACKEYDFEKNARKVGMLMTVDESQMDDIDIQGIGRVSFCDEDGGSIGENSSDDEHEPESEGDRSDGAQESDDSALTDSGGDSEDDTAEVDRCAAEGVGAAIAPAGYCIVHQCPPLSTRSDHQELIGRTILFKWNGTIRAEDFGWYKGKIHSRYTGPTPDLNFNARYSNADTNNLLPAQLSTGKTFKAKKSNW